MSRLSSRALSRTGSPASSTASSVVQTGLEDCTLDELKERLGLYCAHIRFHNPYPSQTADELAAARAATERLADLRRKDSSTRLFIQAARWNRWVDPKGVEHRFAAGGEGEDGVPPTEKQDLSLGLPTNEEDYRRLVEARRARQAAPVPVTVPPSSPAPAPLLTYPDSSLTALTSTSQLPTSSGQRGRSPLPSTPASGASTASARTALKRRASLSPAAAMKTIEPEWADEHAEADPAAAAVDDARPPSAGSSGSSTQSNLAFPVVKAKARGKQREPSAGPTGVDKSGVKRKSTKAAASDGRGKAKTVAAVDLVSPPPPRPPPTAEVDLDEAPWDEDDSVEIAAGKGAAYRQKMRINPDGWDGIEDMSACAEFLPLSFPSDLATSTPIASKRRPPPILKPITSRAPAPSAAVDDRAGQRAPAKADSPKGAGSRKASRAASRAPSRASADTAAAQRPLPMAPTEPTTPASDSPSSHSVPTPPPKRRQHLLSRSSMLGLTSSDSQVGGGPTSSLAKLSADGSLPFSIGISQVDRRVDEVRDFLEAEGEGIDDSAWD